MFAHDGPVAWFMVVAYFCGGAVSYFPSRTAGSRRETWFWLGCTLLLVLLGLNKQLDFQSVITTVGRTLAHQEGWFEYRRLVQAVFVLALGAGAAGAMIVLSIWLRRSARPVKVAAGGLVMLLAFIVLRAASFHHMDAWVTADVAGMRSGWWLELAGILVIGLSAFVYSRRNRSSAG